MLVVRGDPGFQGGDQRRRTGPFLEPKALFLESAYTTRSVGVALGVVIAGEGLMHPQRAARPHERHRGGLTTVVAHQREALPARAVRELTVHRHVQGLQPLLRRTPEAGMVADDLLGTTSRARPRRRPRQSRLPAPWSCQCPTTHAALLAWAYGLVASAERSAAGSAGPGADAPASSATPASY
jgi:hypothetical protein